MKKDKDIKRDDIDFQYASSVVATKSFDNFGVAIIGTCLQDCNKVSSFTRRVKIPVPRPEIIKDYNLGMGGIDLLHQTVSYKLDCKSSGGLY